MIQNTEIQSDISFSFLALFVMMIQVGSFIFMLN